MLLRQESLKSAVWGLSSDRRDYFTLPPHFQVTRAEGVLGRDVCVSSPTKTRNENEGRPRLAVGFHLSSS
jgi:hypothetical protein